MEKRYVNPEGVFNHPAFTGVLTVTSPERLHFIAGRCATDDDYNCVAPGDFLAQFRRVMELLDIELKAVDATWDDVVFRRIYTLDVDAFLEASAEDPVIKGYFDPERMPPSTLIGVTRLSDPEFLIEIDLMAITD